MLERLIRGKSKRAPRNWEQEYTEGKWGFLSGVDEMSRYWVAIGYCALTPRPSLLDVGCGTGVFEEKARLLPYRSYVGLDISPTALSDAHRRMPEDCRLVCADFNDPPITEKFDRIVFMESLEPQLPVVAILAAYEPLLQPNGRIVISLFDGSSGTATARVWKDIAQRFRIEDATRIQNLPTNKAWTVAMLAAQG